MMDIQRIGDELQISALLTRYARAVDTNDWELYRSLFTDDAHIDYSAAGLIAGTREEAIDVLSQRQAEIRTGMHYVTNVEAEIDGNTAKVSATWCAVAGSPGMSNRHFGGRWHHDLIRVGDCWRSRNLRLEIVWS